MKSSRFRRLVSASIVLVFMVSFLILSACMGEQSGPMSFDSGANNLTLSGAQLTQYNLVRFETTAADLTLTLPSAADIVSSFSVPAGSFTALVVTSDGGNKVKITGGTNVIVKPSAAEVPGKNTKTIFIMLKNVNSGQQSVVVY
jgi:hypothetical protein